MRHFLFDESARNDSDDLSSCLKRRVRQFSHQPDFAAAVNNRNPFRDQVSRQ
jgi:hypothetical protein